MKTIVWMHEDGLRPLLPGVPAIFVFEDKGHSLKRIVFLYECLLELDVVIAKGDVETLVRKFAAEHGAERIVTTFTECPRITAQARELGAEMVNDDPFIAAAGPYDLKRFSRYWHRVERKALEL